MSYAQRRSIGASRTFAIAIVALTHASLGYAIVTGLAFTAVQQSPDGFKTFDVEEVQPTAPKPRPLPKKVQQSQPQLVGPPPLVRIDALPLPVAATMLEAPSLVVMPAVLPAPMPTDAEYSSPLPPENDAAPPRSATGDLQNLFRSADYPLTALERHEQGTVTVQLTVGVMGRVNACNVTTSSGSRTLDKVSCRILQSRALFTPARDSSGNLAIDTVRQEIRWVLH